MACKTVLLRIPMLIGLAVPVLMLGQAESISARNILKQSTADQIAFLETAVDLGFPEDRADQITMLVINRSEIALPILTRRVEDALISQTAPARVVYMAVEMIAYAGDEEAIRAVAQLMSADERRFGPYVGRILDNASNWRNPFSLVYRVLDRSDSRVAGLAMKWVEARLDSTNMQRKWAEAMLDNYGKAPGASDWARDPIATRLNAGRSYSLRDQILSAASDVQRDRQRQ